MKLSISTLLNLLFILTAISVSYCQQHDKYWMGQISDWKPVVMGFEGNTISYLMPDTVLIFITKGTVAMGNAEGEFQFYTNGNVVISSDHSIMQGGKGFNEGSPYSDFGVNGADTFYNVPYLDLSYHVIPDDYDASSYYMVHGLVMYDGGANCKGLIVPKMQLSKVDMSASGGKGQVVYKNRYFDEAPMGPCLAMVRHGNGRDWWVVRRSQDGLSYRSSLLHRDTVVLTVLSSVPGLGTAWFQCEDWYVTNLNDLHASRDGNRMIDVYGVGKAKLLDFDRCSGAVSLVDTFTAGSPVISTDHGPVVCPIYSYEFSPSGRYLYGAGCAGVVQWDLEAADFAASRTPIGGIPWQLDDNQNVTGLEQGGLWNFSHGPDGKIYTLLGTSHNIIEHPDEPGEASGICIAADSPPSCLGVPYWLYSTPHPNYRLGPLTGSGCDTILSSANEPPTNSGYGVTASPTVATGQVEVTITLPGYGSASTAEVQVVEMLGRVVHQHRFPPYANLHTLDVSGWPAGLYNVVLLEGGRPRAAARLVVGR